MPQDLPAIFDQVRSLFGPYMELYRVERDGPEGIYLTSFGPAELTFKEKSRSYPTMFFASAALRKTSVVFYYMPVYVQPELKSSLGPDLLKTLKGHTCFHIKKLSPEILAQVKDALEIGHRAYKEKGWA